MKWLAILFSLFILLIIVLTDVGMLSRALRFLHAIPFGDKAGHFILYGILALLINLALFRSRPDQDRIPILLKTGLILGLLIGLEEFSQQFFANRSFDLVDLAFSYLGLVCFSWVALKTNAGRDHSRPA
ncbi:MAG TPA: VanZ family protein [Anaerolineales bacterium]|nr:VanZ family protein [Anaerolineales bacterium]